MMHMETINRLTDEELDSSPVYMLFLPAWLYRAGNHCTVGRYRAAISMAHGLQINIVAYGSKWMA